MSRRRRSTQVHFLPYDDLELGNCSKFEFRKALQELLRAKGLPILPSEVEGWASMFDKKRNGADSASSLNFNVIWWRRWRLHETAPS